MDRNWLSQVGSWHMVPYLAVERGTFLLAPVEDVGADIIRGQRREVDRPEDGQSQHRIAITNKNPNKHGH